MITGTEYRKLTVFDDCTAHALEELWWKGVVENNELLEARYPLTSDVRARSAYFRRVLRGKDTVVFVAAKGSELCGFVVGELRDDSDALLERRKIASPSFLAVDEKLRGRGIATQLMLMFETWAKRKGAKTISFFAFVRNRAETRIFRKLGYDIVSCEFSKILC